MICNQCFRKFSPFKSHFRREERKEELGRLFHAGNANDENNFSGGEKDLQENEEDEEDKVENMKQSLALYLLKTKELNQLSHQALNSILENTSDLVESSLESLKDKIKSCLTANGLELGDINGLTDVLQQPSPFLQAKGHLAT